MASVGVAALSKGFVKLWAAVGGPIALIAIGVLSAFFLAWKFDLWAKGLNLLSRGFDKLKNVLGLMTDAEYEAANAARLLNEDLGDVTPSAEELSAVLSDASLTGTVEELNQAMVNLSEVAGGLLPDQMDMIAERAIELRNAGDDLNPVLEQIVGLYEKNAEAAKEAARAAEELTARQETARLQRLANEEAIRLEQEAIDELAESTADLRAHLLGDALPGEIAQLEVIWGDLSEAQRENEFNIRRLLPRLQALSDEGVELSGAFLTLLHRFGDVGDMAWATSPRMWTLAESLEEVMESALEAQAAMDKFVGPPDLRETEEDIEGIGKVLNDTADDINRVFIAVFEEGGDIAGAIKSLSVTLMAGLLSMIPVIGPFLSRFAGAFVAGAAKLGSILFGGPSAAEKDARELVKVFEDQIISSLDEGQLSEAGGRRWAQVVIGVRDAFLATGRTALEGEAMVQKLWDAIKHGGPDAVRAVIATIQPILDEAGAIDLLLTTTTEGLQGLLDEAVRTGELLPDTLEPYLVTLAELGADGGQLALIRTLMGEMADAAEVDWKGMEEAADRYGISLATLGDKFASSKLREAATEILADFDLLTEGGADVGGVLFAMKEEINALVLEAMKAGIKIPAAMEPIVEHLLEEGHLLDENGNKLTSLGNLEFADPIVDKFDLLITAIQDLIDSLIGPGGATDAINAVATEPLPDRVIHIGFDVEPIVLPPMPSGIVIPADFENFVQLSNGTGGEFRNFGTGTPAILHGRERVTPISEAGNEGMVGVDVLEKRLGSIEQLLRDQPQKFGIAVSDSLALMN
jgi:hypothetical protein